MDFVQEVTEEFRQEQWLKTWKRIAPYVIGAVATILLVSLIVIGYNRYDAHKRAGASDQFMQALTTASTGNVDGAIKILDGVQGATYGTIGQLGKALALARQDKNVQALGVYEALMADKKAEPIFQEFARLQAGKYQLSQKNAQKAFETLAPLVKTSHWRVMATELQGLALLDLGKKKEAFDLFQGLIQSPSTANDIKDRARVMVDYIDVDGKWRPSSDKTTK